MKLMVLNESFNFQPPKNWGWFYINLKFETTSHFFSPSKHNKLRGKISMLTFTLTTCLRIFNFFRLGLFLGVLFSTFSRKGGIFSDFLQEGVSIEFGTWRCVQRVKNLYEFWARERKIPT